MTLNPENQKESAEINEIFSNESVKKLIDMLSYQRPSGHDSNGDYAKFLEKYIDPVFGSCDRHGNYVKIIHDIDEEGNKIHPRIAYMAHHDTVHKNNRFSKNSVKYFTDKNGTIWLCVDNSKLPKISYTFSAWNHKTKKNEQKTRETIDTKHEDYANCLGADCTTGVWLILEMIESGCPGVYVIHADEEIGCLGSTAMVDDYNKMTNEEKQNHWISKVDICMSFDRYGESSIITYQTGSRTASDEFASSLSSIFESFYKSKGYEPLKADDGGSYTDSNEYADVISECTNLSVGYDKQHSDNEVQNLNYVLMLRDALVLYAYDLNNPEKLPATRDPKEADYLYGNYGSYGRNYNYGYTFGRQQSSYRDADYWDEDYYSGKKKGDYYSNNQIYKFPVYYSDGSYPQQWLKVDIEPIEFDLEDHIEESLLKNRMFENSSEDRIDDMSSWIKSFPYLTASLLDNMGIKPKDFIKNLKLESNRRRRLLSYEKLFSKDKDKQEQGEEVNNDEIPFDQSKLKEVLGVVDTKNLLVNRSQIVEKLIDKNKSTKKVVVENEIEG